MRIVPLFILIALLASTGGGFGDTLPAPTSSVSIGQADSGQFDQLTTFQSADNRPPDGAFDGRFQSARALHFDVYAALDYLGQITATHSEPPLPIGPKPNPIVEATAPLHNATLDIQLRQGIARHYEVDGHSNRVRIDDYNSEKTFLIDCNSYSLVTLDHKTHHAYYLFVNPLTLQTSRGTLRQIFVFGRPSNVSATINATAGATTTSLMSRTTLSGLVAGDDFAYRYDYPIPRMACGATDSNWLMQHTGVLGPFATANLYFWDFKSLGLNTSRPAGALSGNDFTALSFRLGTIFAVRGSIERGNVRSGISPADFDVPSTDTRVQFSATAAPEARDAYDPP